MTKSAKKFWYIWDKIGVICILLVIGLIYAILNPAIIAPEQLLTALSRSAITGIAAAGMTFAICGGGFDLSIGSIISFTSVVAASYIIKGSNIGVTFLVTFLVAILCGLINGLVITKLKIPTFVATLATSLAFAGAALVYSDGSAIQLTSKVNKDIKFLSTGTIFEVIPISIALIVTVYVIAFFVYKYTSFGIKVRAVGSNEAAARTTGINVDHTLILIFVVTSVTATIAAMLNLGRLSTGNPTMGAGYELDAITAVILGGTSLAGGKGNILGTLVGAVLVTFVKMGLNMLGVGEAYQKLAVAGVLLLALAINGIKLIMQKEEK